MTLSHIFIQKKLESRPMDPGFHKAMLQVDLLLACGWDF